MSRSSPVPTQDPEAAPPKMVGATVATLSIVRWLCAAGKGQRLSDIVQGTGLNTSTAFNILRTLVVEGLVTAAPDKTYRMSGEISHLARAAAGEAATPSLRERMAGLAETYNVSIGHWTVRGDRLVLLQCAESRAQVKLTQRPGWRIPLLGGAIGRAFAAATTWSEDELARRFTATSWRKPQNVEDFLAAVRTARMRGWVDDEGFILPGVRTVAAPLTDRAGRPIGVLAASMFSGQHEAATREAIGLSLIRIAGGDET